MQLSRERKKKIKKQEENKPKDTWAWRSCHFQVFFPLEKVRTGVD